MRKALILVVTSAGILSIAPFVAYYTWVYGTVVLAILTAEYETYLIPEGYVGPILVVYVGTDENFSSHGQDITYEMPASGVLKVQSGSPKVYTSRFYYVSEDGKRTEIPFLDSCNAPPDRDPVVVCRTSELMSVGDKKSYRHKGFIVGRSSEHRQFDEVYYGLQRLYAFPESSN